MQGNLFQGNTGTGPGQFNGSIIVVNGGFSGDSVFSNNTILENNATDYILQLSKNISAQYNLFESNVSSTGILKASSPKVGVLHQFNRLIGNVVGPGEGCVVNADGTSALSYSHIISNTAKYWACTSSGGSLPNNYWGTNDTNLLKEKILDFDDNHDYGRLKISLILSQCCSRNIWTSNVVLYSNIAEFG